jgi:hypothetical protein
MDRWQYRHFITRSREFTRVQFAFGADFPGDHSGQSLSEILTRWGREGWELVGMASVDGDRLLFVFKRPVPGGSRVLTGKVGRTESSGSDAGTRAK